MKSIAAGAAWKPPFKVKTPPKRAATLLAQPGGIDHRARHTGSSQRAQMPLQQRHALHGQQRLGARVGQRAHAFATAGGQQHGGNGGVVVVGGAV